MNTVLPPFRPKMIVWHLPATSGEPNHPPVSHTEIPENGQGRGFSTQECLLVIDSIVRLARPIIVFSGSSTLQRTDLFSITEYTVALGLKVIIEVHPLQLNEDLVRKFSVFGPRIFRVMVDDCIVEDLDHRYRQTETFRALENAVNLIRRAGLELHLGATVHKPDLRQIEYDHDYAVRQSAVGLYCHFCFDETTEGATTQSVNIEALIEAIAQMKSFSPKDMYFSPQCVRYSHKGSQTFIPINRDHPAGGSESAAPSDDPKSLFSNPPSEWLHWCMGGKTFAFIAADGVVQLCAGISAQCGNLRDVGYDFSKIWERSPVLQCVRDNEWSCIETRERLIPKSNTSGQMHSETTEPPISQRNQS